MTRTRSLQTLQCGVLAGLALLIAIPAAGDELLRKRVHAEYGHRSYMLIEDAAGARLFLFADATSDAAFVRVEVEVEEPAFFAALAKTRSDDVRARVRGLTELAGMEDDAALDVALTLLSDPSPAVRDEAKNLILDHPAGGPLIEALGLEDDEWTD